VQYEVEVRDSHTEELSSHLPEKEVPDHSKHLMSPMPGAITSINVQVGDEVAPGFELCVVEAMKMQNVLRAQGGGKIAHIHVNVGDVVVADELLMDLE